VFLAVVALGSPARSFAASEHSFDPGLSLRGDCKVSALDTVSDPGPCPGIPGVDHPPIAFEQPCGAAVDAHGDIYVANAAEHAPNGPNGPIGRIDVFDSHGKYLTQINDEYEPCGLAVDSKGNVYVAEYTEKRVVMFEPKTYPPTAGAEYGGRTIVYDPFAEGNPGSNPCLEARSIAVDPSNDHLYIGQNCKVREYRSAAEGSTMLDENVAAGSGLPGFFSIGVYGSNHDVYVTTVGTGGKGRVAVVSGADGHVKCSVEGPSAESSFGFTNALAGIAVDQATGDFYVDDIGGFGHEGVDQFSINGETCSYVGQLTHSFQPIEGVNLGGASLVVDDPCLDELTEPCGAASYDSPNIGYVYVGQGSFGASVHLYAFRVGKAGPPSIQGQTARVLSETEAVLEAEIDPGDLQTHYDFEYVTETDYLATGYANATKVPVSPADAGDGGAFVPVSEPISGLQSGTAYRFRAVATNCEAPGATAGECLSEGEGIPGKTGNDAGFSTYFPDPGLPDARAYELVTPPDTNGRVPSMSELGLSSHSNFTTSLTTPDGEGLAIGIQGGALPFFGGGGYDDTYEARRTAAGWQIQFTGLSASQAEEPHSGGIAPDHLHALWEARGVDGNLVVPNTGVGATYIRRPGAVADSICSPEPVGHFEWIGCGSLGAEPFAGGNWISEGGAHIIFSDDPTGPAGVHAARIEPCSPPAGTGAVYDRTLDGVTHCVSLLPGDVTPQGGENARYVGASADGTAVAFTVGSNLYVRRDDFETIEVANSAFRFGGLSENGDSIVYLHPNSVEPLRSGTVVPQGEVFSCDLAAGPCAGPGAHPPVQVGSGEKSVLVNVSGDGSHIFFVSPKRLEAGKGKLGADNLYDWHSGAAHFIGILVAPDIEGEESPNAGATRVDGLGLWIPYGLGQFPGGAAGAASDPSRSTPNGSVLVFQSHAALTGYANAGRSEVYRYDATAAAGERLLCVSCNQTGAGATSDAQLQSDFGQQLTALPPVNEMTPVANVTTDGDTIFFQSGDRLSVRDTDGKVDVYEWEGEGPKCERETGCIHLISGGHSAHDDFLYAVAPDGRNVFFESGDLLVPQDLDHTPSIYDARVEGGFPAPPPVPVECVGEACQPTSSPPGEPGSAVESDGNLPTRRTPKPHCGKGRHALRRHGKWRCLRNAKNHAGARLGKGGR
jgi:hypothetical protein